MLVGNLSELTKKKDLLSLELKKAHDNVKNLKISVQKVEKEITGIVDELSGKISYPILDLAEAQTQEQKLISQASPIKDLQEIAQIPRAIPFERIGRRGDIPESVLFYLGEDTFEASLDVLEIHLIGADPKSYTNYEALCDAAWEELIKCSDNELLNIIEESNPVDKDRILYKLQDPSPSDKYKLDKITLFKGTERREIPSWMITEKRLAPVVNCYEQESLREIWQSLETDPSKMTTSQRFESKPLSEKFQILKIENNKITMYYQKESRTFGTKAMIDNLTSKLPYYDAKSISDLSQGALSELWHNPEGFIPKEELIKPLKKPDGSLILSKKSQSKRIEADFVDPESMDFSCQFQLDKLWNSSIAQDYKHEVDVISFSGKKKPANKKQVKTASAEA